MDPHVAWPVAMQGEGARHEVRHEAEAQAEDVDTSTSKRRDGTRHGRWRGWRKRRGGMQAMVCNAKGGR